MFALSGARPAARTLGLALGLKCLTTPASAAVETPPAHGEPTWEGSASAAPAPEHRLNWNYPRFRWWQWGLSIAASGYFTWSVLREPHDVDIGWHGGGPVDDWMREQLAAEGHAGRRKANEWSNYTWHPIEFFPFVDSIVVALFFDDFNVDVAWQMTLLNWQGIAVMGAVNRLTHDWMARDRPALIGCAEEGPEYSHYCSGSRNATQSFISGHAGSVFFGAGATCAHHMAFPMYGHPVADYGICALMLGGATLNGILRVVADSHWTTDVLAGGVAGFGAGFGLAYGLHYAWPMTKLREANMLLMPSIGEQELSLQLTGAL